MQLLLSQPTSTDDALVERLRDLIRSLSKISSRDILPKDQEADEHYATAHGANVDNPEGQPEVTLSLSDQLDASIGSLSGSTSKRSLAECEALLEKLSEEVGVALRS